MGQADHGNTDREIPLGFIAYREGVLARERQGKIRDNAKDRKIRDLFDLLYSRGKDCGIAAELVDDDPFYERPDGLRQELYGPVDLGKDAAPLDIGDKDDGDSELFGKQGICDVASRRG